MFSKFRYFLLIPLATAAMLAVLTGSAAAAPTNDNFASSQTLSGTLPITVSGNNIDATAETGEPEVDSNPPISSVWYSWTATATQPFVLDTCHDEFSGGGYFNPALGIYTGNTLGTLVSVAGENGRCSLRFLATLGTTYRFQVDYYDHEGTFKLTLRHFAPPLNDSFGAPTVLGPALPISTDGTTVDSTWQAGEPPSLGGSSSSRSVWYRWTAPATERVRLSLCEKTVVDGPANDSTVVYTGATLGTLVEVVSLTSNDCNVDFPVTSGTTYRIVVSGDSKGEFEFKLGLKAAPPPANDDFANAQVLSPGLPVNSAGNNDFATEEAGEPNHGGYPNTSRSVWFRWTAPVSGPMRIKTCNPELQLYTSVYTGTMLNALTEVSQKNYWAPCSRFFDAVAGTTYRIAVAGAPFTNTHGPFALNIHQVSPPANDSFASAVNLGSAINASVDGTTVDATWEDDEPSHDEGFGVYGGSVWYRWTAPNDNAAIFSACSTGQPTRITVFDANPEADEPGSITGLRIVDSDYDSCRNGTKGGRLAIAPVTGAQYFIGVTAYNPDYESPFTLEVKGFKTPTVSKPPAFSLKKAIAKCRKIKGKGRKARRKRANCIRKARLKAAIIKCKKIDNPGQQKKCIKKARKRFG